MNLDVKSCKTCRWAKWQLKPNGKPNFKAYGLCTYKVTVPALPRCVKVPYFDKSAIWSHDKDECPVHDKI